MLIFNKKYIHYIVEDLQPKTICHMVRTLLFSHWNKWYFRSFSPKLVAVRPNGKPYSSHNVRVFKTCLNSAHIMEKKKFGNCNQLSLKVPYFCMVLYLLINVCSGRSFKSLAKESLLICWCLHRCLVKPMIDCSTFSYRTCPKYF